MPRPRRDFTTSDRFHVINRGIDGQDVFSVSDDWVLFEHLIGRVCDDHGFRLNAYAMMSTHFHFLVDLSACDERSDVSDGIGVLQSTYSKYFNERTTRRGPLFEPRFLSFGVDGESKLNRVIRYIHRNPIDICGPRALGAYRWSSLPAYLGRRAAPTWLDVGLFAPQRPDDYLAELTDCDASDIEPLDALQPLRRVTTDAIIDAIRELDRSIVDRQTRADLVLMLALDLRADDVTTLSARFGFSEVTIRRRAHICRSRRRDDPSFDRLIERVQLAVARKRHD